MTSLYRLRDTSGRLLYVGIAGNPGRRFEQHAGDKPWWGQVASITLEHHPDRGAALDAERHAIQTEAPAYNVIHNRSTPRMDTPMSQPETSNTNSLVGQLFHSLSEEGNVNWQGLVKGQVEPGVYLVETYSWINGCKYSNQLVKLEDMMGWIFYDTDEEMEFSYEHGAAKKHRADIRLEREERAAKLKAAGKTGWEPVDLRPFLEGEAS